MITEREFVRLLRESRSAFSLDYQREPQDREAEAFRWWLAGKPLTPAEFPVWRKWLDGKAEIGTDILRVILTDEPPTSYQQWRMWAAPWHEAVGDHMRFLPLATAQSLGVPPWNWWLFECRTLVLFHPKGMKLTTSPEIVSKYEKWRGLVVRHATALEAVSA